MVNFIFCAVVDVYIKRSYEQFLAVIPINIVKHKTDNANLTTQVLPQFVKMAQICPNKTCLDIVLIYASRSPHEKIVLSQEKLEEFFKRKLAKLYYQVRYCRWKMPVNFIFKKLYKHLVDRALNWVIPQNTRDFTNRNIYDVKF